VKLQRRTSVPAEVEVSSPPPDVVGKGRPTPKRRDTAPKRQPLAAPRTTKEANRWRKQQNSNTQVRKGPSAGKPLSGREYREALRRGDESVLPKRDKGEVRRLARDWVDTRRMASNYLLLAFPRLLFSSEVKLPYRIGTYVTVAVFVLFFCEWTWAGRRIHALAVSRFGTVRDKPFALGLYAGQRSFMPRRWRAPAATLKPGDPL
jgi:hypothetical protein